MPQNSVPAADLLPQLRSQMRCERGQHQDQGLENARNRSRRNCAGRDRRVCRGQFIRQLHNRGDRSIEVPAAAEVLRDLTDRLVQFAQQGSCSRRCFRSCGDRTAGQLRMPHNKAIDPRQEAAYARDAIFLPIQIAIRRRSKQCIHARCIGAIARDHLVRRHHIALRLRHLRAVLDHHPLRKETCRRLVIPNHSQVAHHLGPEARVNQVQNGVLHAADVLIDGEPIRHRRSIKWR